MKARLFGVNLGHEFFAHLSADQKNETYREMDRLNGVIYSFEEKENEPVFAAVIIQLFDRIHVQEVGGNFIFNMGHCEKLCRIFAKKFGKEKISFCARNKVAERVGKRHGFVKSHDGFENEFEKAV